MQIEWRQRITARDDALDARQPRQERQQRPLNLENDPPPRRNSRHEATELKRVAQALLRMQQQDPILDISSIPEGLAEAAEMRLFRLLLPSPLVFPPAFVELAGQQQRDPKVEMRVGIVRPLRHRRSQTLNGFISPPKIVQQRAEIVVRLRPDRIALESGPIVRLRFVETTGLAKGVAQDQLRRNIVRLQTQSFPAAGFRLFRPPPGDAADHRDCSRPRGNWPEFAGLAKIELGLVEAPQFDEKTTKIVMGLRKSRVEAQGLAIATLAFPEGGEIEQHGPKIAVGLGKIWPLPQHLPKLADRIVELLPSHQQIGEMETGIDLSAGCTEVEAGSMSQHEPVLSLLTGEIPAFTQQETKLNLRLQILGLMPQRFPVARDGLAPASERAQSDRHVAVIDAVARLKLDGAHEEIERPVGVTGLERSNPQEENSVRMIRLGCQDPPIDRLRLRHRPAR